jgi:ATP-dependent DNA helicase DinG
MSSASFDLDSLTPEGVSTWDELFPFPDYREKQRQTMIAVIQALHDPQYDNVVVDAPTGVGKSAINVAACRSFDSAFYITPQKKLREQLQNDNVLAEYYRSLRARRDYTCGVTGTDCDSCKINRSPSESCADYVDEDRREGNRCTYWMEKLRAIDSETAVLTFAYLVTDGNIPPTDGNGNQISFSNRELLVVDECHGLENQVASLFAGFKVSPWTVPPDVYRDIARHLDMDTSRCSEVMDIMETLRDRCRAYKQEHEHQDDYADQVSDCEKFIDNAEWFFKEVDEWDRDWVVDMDKTRHPDKNKKVKSFQLKPVKVDSYLDNFVWRRANTRLLTTATMPYRGNPSAWCRRIGLDPERTHVIKVGMPFPAQNRPVHVHTEIAKMSSGGDDKNWNKIMAELERLAGKHEGENGLIHTASYKRAQRVYNSVKKGDYPNLEGNLLFHDAEKDTPDFIGRWQDSSENVVLSPSMMEGVDLSGDMCRWQVLLKVPYPNMGDSRVDFLMDKDTGYGADWQWYNETTAQSIIQSVGRAVRSKDDYADFYVLDESFESVRKQVAFPDWFEAAITNDPEGAQENATSSSGAQDPLDF